MEQVINANMPCFTQLRGSSHTQIEGVSILAAGSHTQDGVSQIVAVVHKCEWQQSCNVPMEPIQGQESFLGG